MTCLPSPCKRLSRSRITMEAPSPFASRRVGDPVFRLGCKYRAHRRRPTHSLQLPPWSSSISPKESQSFLEILAQGGIDVTYASVFRTHTTPKIVPPPLPLS